MALNKTQLLAKRISVKPIIHDLPDGDQVKFRPASVKIYRDYKRFLRDKNGEPIEERQVLGDELLIGRLLLNDEGDLMFTDDEIMQGVLDEVQMPVFRSMVAKTYEMVGIFEADAEDREKNSSATDSIEPS